MAAAHRVRLPAVVAPQDLLLTSIVDAAVPPGLFGFALELVGPGGWILAALRRADSCSEFRCLPEHRLRSALNGLTPWPAVSGIVLECNAWSHIIADGFVNCAS